MNFKIGLIIVICYDGGPVLRPIIGMSSPGGLAVGMCANGLHWF